MQEEVDAAAEAAEEAKAEGTAEAKTDAEAEAKKDPSPESTLAASHQETPSADAFAEATAAAEAAREEAASLRESPRRRQTFESLAEASSAEAAREEAASLREQLEDTSAVAAAAAEAAQEEVTEAEERAANLRERLYSTSTELASAAKAAENAAQAEATLLREAAKKTLARAQRFVLSRAFDGWVWRVSQKRRLRALAQRATERLTKNAKAMTFREWRRTARNIGAQGSKTAREEAENLRAKLWRDRVARSERFLLALMRHKLRRAFASWSTTTRESRRRIRAATKILARAQRFALSRAFDGWVWRASEKRRHRALAQRATERLTKNAKAMTFREWRRTARENIEAQAAKAARERRRRISARAWMRLRRKLAQRRQNRWMRQWRRKSTQRIFKYNSTWQMQMRRRRRGRLWMRLRPRKPLERRRRISAQNSGATAWRGANGFSSPSCVTNSDAHSRRGLRRRASRDDEFAPRRKFSRVRNGLPFRARSTDGCGARARTAPSRVGATRNGASDEKREGDDVSRVAANRAREYRGSGRESRSRGGGESPQEPGCDYGGSSRNDDRIGGCGSENPRSESSSTTRVANADAAEASRSALDEAQAAKTAREEAENLRAKLGATAWRGAKVQLDESRRNADAAPFRGVGWVWRASEKRARALRNATGV